MDQLQSRLEALEHQVQTLHQQTRTVARQLRWWRGLAGGLLVLAGLTWALPTGTAQEESPSIAQLAVLEHTLRHVTSATDAEGRPRGPHHRG